MYTSIILTALAATFAVASPLPQSSSASSDHYVHLSIITSAPSESEQSTVIKVNLNELRTVPVEQLYKIEFNADANYGNTDAEYVECRAYKDTDGVVPGSAPFNYNQPANIATNPVNEGVVLCYRVTDDEASKF